MSRIKVAAPRSRGIRAEVLDLTILLKIVDKKVLCCKMCIEFSRCYAESSKHSGAVLRQRMTLDAKEVSWSEFLRFNDASFLYARPRARGFK